MRARSPLRYLHRLAGLVAGAFLLVAGLSGSLLVFAPELDRQLNADLWEAAPQTARIPVQTALDRARRAFPAEHAVRVCLPRTPAGAYEIAMAGDGAEPWKNDRLVYVDPHNGDILDMRLRSDALRWLLWQVHTEWLLGENGATAVGIAGLFLLGLCISGLILWWPQRSRFFKQCRWTSYRLHQVAGVCFAAVLVPIALTGVCLAFSSTSASAFNWLTASPSPPPAPQSAIAATVQPSLDQILRHADAALPGGRTVWIDLPASALGAYKVRKKMPEEISSPNGMSYVYLDQYDGKVLLVDDVSLAPLGTRLNRMLFAIHTGAFGETAARALFVIVGFIPGVLGITGFRQWRRRRHVPASPRPAAGKADAVVCSGRSLNKPVK